MKLEEAIKSGRRFRPADSKFDEWGYGWLKVGNYTKSVEDERDYQVKMFVGWFDRDWELEPEEVTKEDKLKYLDDKAQELIDTISKGVATATNELADSIKDLASEVDDSSSRLTTLEDGDAVNNLMIEDFIQRVEVLEAASTGYDNTINTLTTKLSKLTHQVHLNDEDLDEVWSDVYTPTKTSSSVKIRRYTD